MAHIQTGNQMVTQITVIEAEPEKQNEALSLMAERARFMASQLGFVYPFVIMDNTMPPRVVQDPRALLCASFGDGLPDARPHAGRRFRHHRIARYRVRGD